MRQEGWLSLLLSPRRFAALIALVAVMGGGWILGARLAPAERTAGAAVSAQTGFSAPEIALPALNGGTVRLSEQRGKVVLLNLWASWCGPCRAEMPAIENVYVKYRDAGFVVLAANATYQDDELGAVQFARSLGLSFPILFDHSAVLNRDYRLRSLPTSYYIGRDGIIREIVIGGSTQAAIESRVKRLLAGGR